MTTLCLLLQLLLLLAAKNLLRFWLHPVVVLISLWTAVLTSTVILAAEYYFSIEACFILLFLEMVAVCGGACGFLGAGSAGGPKNIYFVGLRTIVWSSMAVGVAAVAAVVSSRGVSLIGLANPDTLLDVTHDFSVARYEDDYQMPLFARAAQMYVFFAIIVSSLEFATSRRLRKLEYLCPFVPLALTAIVLTTRGTLIYGGIFWFGAFVAGRLWHARTIRQPLIGRKAVVTGVGVLAAFSVVFVTLQFLRGGVSDVSRLPEILAHLKKWPFGSFAGFSIWYDSGGFTELSYGYYNFTGLFDLLGIRGRETGLYDKYVDLGGGAYGNIYTIFRGLIEDFSMPGACLSMFIFGVASSVAASKTLARRIEGLWLLVCLYPVAMFSPVVNFYIYFGHMAACLLALAYLLFVARVRKPSVVAA